MRGMFSLRPVLNLEACIPVSRKQEVAIGGLITQVVKYLVTYMSNFLPRQKAVSAVAQSS